MHTDQVSTCSVITLPLSKPTITNSPISFASNIVEFSISGNLNTLVPIFDRRLKTPSSIISSSPLYGTIV